MGACQVAGSGVDGSDVPGSDSAVALAMDELVADVGSALLDVVNAVLDVVVLVLTGSESSPLEHEASVRVRAKMAGNDLRVSFWLEVFVMIEPVFRVGLARWRVGGV